MKTILISAFPGTGKSFYTKHKKRWNERVWDSDSSKFDKKDFPSNYIKHINEGIGFADIIFISSHNEVRKALLDNEMTFILVYPDKSLKGEYLNRFRERGSPEGFIKLIESNWDEWIDECKQQKSCEHIVLKSDQFISDVINLTSK